MKTLLVTLIFSSVFYNAQTRIIAHRGYWKTENSAQNSVSSLRNAQQQQFYGSEFDVRMSKDGKLVVNHDEHINGLEISETSFSKLRTQKLKNGEKIPTFAKYLKAGRKVPAVKLIVELKPAKSVELENKLVQKALKEVEKYGVGTQCEFISFSLNICKELKKLQPNATVQYLNGDLTPQQLKDLGIDGFDYNFKILQKNPAWISEAKNLGLVTNSWTVNDETVYLELKNAGIDFVTTDIPTQLKNK